jgi:hypothetical protein
VPSTETFTEEALKQRITECLEGISPAELGKSIGSVDVRPFVKKKTEDQLIIFSSSSSSSSSLSS